MQINLLEYLENKIGDTSWHGETNHDNVSADNMMMLDSILTDLEDVRENLLSRLYEHEEYKKGNASAEYLHKLAMSVLEGHGEKLEEK